MHVVEVWEQVLFLRVKCYLVNNIKVFKIGILRQAYFFGNED